MAASLTLQIPILLSLFFQSSLSSSHNSQFSLSVEKPQDVILSQNLIFSAGFFAVGDNAFVFAVWFTDENPTVVWMANRDHPVKGKGSSLTLRKTGNLVLSDAGQYNVWSTDTTSSSPTRLTLNNNGNLVLYEQQLQGNIILWQSFDFPTHTLLPGQQLTSYTNLVSSRSETNHSSGFYKLSFDYENLLTLVYDGPDVSSKYWPPPGFVSWHAGRSSFNSSRIAVLDSLGGFNSSDKYHFTTSDYGIVIPRRLKLDSDGNIRVYSFHNNTWEVTWQAISDGCIVHGICGVNSTCDYDPREGRRKCLCLPGYRVKNHSDWSYGCEPKFQFSWDKNEFSFLKLPNVDFYGYDLVYPTNITYSECERKCLKEYECNAFQYKPGDESFFCYTKGVLINGHKSPSFTGVIYVKIPKSLISNNGSFHEEEEEEEDYNVCSVKLGRVYIRRQVSKFVKFFLWFTVAIGVIEILFISIAWFSLMRTKKNSNVNQIQAGYNFISPFGFKRFTYSDLKQATNGFKQEIGRGSGGVVYKGVLADQRIIAVKKLNNNMVGGKQEEREFLAEVSIIGRLNHMNLIEMWGYCVEGNHRLLVSEYMENGSLAQNLKSNSLDWTKRYSIALGTARVLSYLHEECLEWILHCDIKPHNILLDSNYQPKLSDFGLSKLHIRNDQNSQSMSMIRGTRGYMAPEWVFNLPITSKVDVYSYGIVVLEMITGRSPTMMGIQSEEEGTESGKLVTWVRGKRKKTTSCCWVEQIIDPTIASEYGVEKRKMETLAKVALECVQEDKGARPTMSQVFEMLQSHEDDDNTP